MTMMMMIPLSLWHPKHRPLVSQTDDDDDDNDDDDGVCNWKSIHPPPQCTLQHKLVPFSGFCHNIQTTQAVWVHKSGNIWTSPLLQALPEQAVSEKTLWHFPHQRHDLNKLCTCFLCRALISRGVKGHSVASGGCLISSIHPSFDIGVMVKAYMFWNQGSHRDLNFSAVPKLKDFTPKLTWDVRETPHQN